MLLPDLENNYNNKKKFTLLDMEIEKATSETMFPDPLLGLCRARRWGTFVQQTPCFDPAHH